jgi:hypothetical protein
MQLSTTPWRRMREGVLDGCEWSVSRLDRFTPRGRPPVPIGQEAGCAPDSVSLFCLLSRGKSLALTYTTPSVQPVAQCYPWPPPPHSQIFQDHWYPGSLANLHTFPALCYPGFPTHRHTSGTGSSFPGGEATRAWSWIFISIQCWGKEWWSYALFPNKPSRRHDDLIKKLRGLSPRANYTDRATAACRRS